LRRVEGEGVGQVCRVGLGDGVDKTGINQHTCNTIREKSDENEHVKRLSNHLPIVSQKKEFS
jgi:hypothetical protein